MPINIKYLISSGGLTNTESAISITISSGYTKYIVICTWAGGSYRTSVSGCGGSYKGYVDLSYSQREKLAIYECTSSGTLTFGQTNSAYGRHYFVIGIN